MLSIIIGPMFSGKTSYLLNEISKEKLLNKKILVINHSLDKRYSSKNEIVNHNKKSESSISLNKLHQIYEYLDVNNLNLSEIEHIFIDEAQFFTDINDIVRKILNNYPNINITCCGLDGDYQQNPFNNGELLKLIPLSENIQKLYSKCYICNNKAAFTKRIINNNEQILVGSNNSYQPVCFIHK